MSNATLNAVRQLFKALVQHGKFDRVLNKVNHFNKQNFV